jgi:Ca-activated chloride channel family protein
MSSALLLLAAALAQEPIRVEVGLVTVAAKVTDRHGRDIRGLRKEQFQLREDRIAQEIAFFSSEEQPITLGIVLDHSGSMAEAGKLERAKQAAVALLRAARGGSEFFFLDFASYVQMPVGLTADRAVVERLIDGTREGGGTRLYDAVLAALDHAAGGRHRRQAIVLISDGSDEHSARSLEDVVAAIQESNAQIYAIGYFSPRERRALRGTPAANRSSSRRRDEPRATLERLARESGGEAYFPTSARELANAVERIATELRVQYTLCYYPKAPPREGVYRRIEVKAGAYAIRSRPGYVVRMSVAAAPRSDAAYRSRRERTASMQRDRDDISDPGSGWPEGPGMGYVAGGYQLAGPRALVANGPELEDVRARVTIDLRGPAGSPSIHSPLPAATRTGAGMIFRESISGFYTLLWMRGSDLEHDMIVLYLQRRSGAYLLETWQLEPRPVGPAVLEIVCRGGSIEVHFAGRRIGSTTDATLARGRLGLVFEGEGNAWFDDLEATSPP